MCCFHMKQKTSGKTEKVRPSAPITILPDTTDFTFYSEEEQKLVSFVTKPGYTQKWTTKAVGDEELLWGGFCIPFPWRNVSRGNTGESYHKSLDLQLFIQVVYILHERNMNGRGLKFWKGHKRGTYRPSQVGLHSQKTMKTMIDDDSILKTKTKVGH